jgi:hypothetical protein
MMLLVGCGGGGPALSPVSGTVTFDGKPLAKGRICFQPAAGRPAYGDIVDGKIVDVTTLEKGDGAIVGAHKVGITSVEEAADMYTPSKSLIPGRYADPKKSGLSAEIKQGESNEVAFELKAEVGE